jgi:hypothetical protein
MGRSNNEEKQQKKGFWGLLKESMKKTSSG